MALIYIIMFVYVILPANGFSGEIVSYSDPQYCNASEYFNAYLFKCVACNPTKHLIPTSTKLSCMCNVHSKIINSDINGFPECELCPNNGVSTSDQRDCISCPETITWDNRTICESCSRDSVKVERYMNGSLRAAADCLQCTRNTTPSIDKERCIPCPFNLIYTGGGNCTCPANTHEYLDGVCIPRGSMLGDWPDDRNSYMIEYDNGEKIESNFLRKHLRAAVYLCFNKNRTACQILANMCTMVMFRDNYKGSPCRMFQNSKHIPTLESNTLPWLYYGEGDAQSVLSRKKIVTKYGLDSNSKTSRLNFTAVSFSADGKFRGVSTVPGSFLQLCPGSWYGLEAGLRVGLRYRSSCRIPAQQLVALAHTQFFDLYLQYWDGAESLLYAVPVLVLNMKAGGSSNNQGSDTSQWQLTRRFFLIDKISGQSAATEKLNPNRNDDSSVVQYLQSCKIRVRVQGQEEEGKIYPPLLVVKYGQISKEDLKRNAPVNIEFGVDYEMESSMPHAVEVSMGVMCALAVVWSGIQSWSNSRRSGRVAIDLITIAKLVLFSCGNLANAFFFVIICASLHIFIFYKGQSVIQVLLPNAEQEALIRAYIIAAFSLKIVEVVHLIWNQVSIDIFLVDWERPRARNPTLRPRSKSTTSAPGDGVEQQQPVSIWRTHFVANEWNEIQTQRRVSLLLQLLITVLMLKVIGMEHWATADPELHTGTPDYMEKTPPSMVCRLAVGVLVYLAAYCLQWIFVVAVYERYIKNGIQEFVDICSLANVSVFILSLENYGYYIHGRSAHGFADTDMQTILSQLQREEEDLCGHRGLMPGTDQQTFQMSVPYQLRAYYRQLMAPISSVVPANRQSFSGTGGLRAKMATGIMERSVQAYHAMNKFLAAFLEHALKDLDYEVREKLFVESLLDIDFTETSDRGVLYSDNGHSFDNVLFYGHELTLATFDIMLFSFVEVIFQDFLLAIIVSVSASKLLTMIRQFGGKKNLAKKTLIDERFLI